MRLFIRTQASTQIGMGHFMRCYALAEEARRRDVTVTFLMDEAGAAVQTRCAEIAAQVVEIGATVASASDIVALTGLGLTRDDWLVIDSYAADADYIDFQHKATRVAVLDDLALLDRYDCDLLINPAMAAPGMTYHTSARRLLGADYALIRREFCHAAGTDDGHVTVMFGGADPTGLTGQCVQGLADALPNTEIRVIVGPANTHTNALLNLSKRIQNIRIMQNPSSVAAVLTGSAMVITAAGGSVGEVAAMGLPALVLVVYDNQMAALSACPFPAVDARDGLPDDLGAQVKAFIDNPIVRSDIAARAHAVVDGHGPRRILEAMHV